MIPANPTLMNEWFANHKLRDKSDYMDIDYHKINVFK